MLHLIIGGNGSGKSAYAEDCILKLKGNQRIYIATMQPFDEESRQKILRHQKMRADKCFETIECPTNLRALKIPSGADVLLECLSNLTANEMYQDDGAKEATVTMVSQGIEAIASQAKNIIVVTNDIFADIANYSDETKKYQEYLGTINQRVAKEADIVTEVVYGTPVTLKG